MTEKEQKAWTVIFLVDGSPVTKVVTLQRAPAKSFAPGYYTGIGGKLGDIPGLEDETPLEGAYRELNEETEGEVNKENIKLTELARCIYDSGLILHYFWGVYEGIQPPHINPDDGTLYWISTEELFDRDIIPTTEAVCREWQKRDFKVDTPFTVIVHETGQDRGVRMVDVIEVEEGLSELS